MVNLWILKQFYKILTNNGNTVKISKFPNKFVKYSHKNLYLTDIDNQNSKCATCT